MTGDDDDPGLRASFHDQRRDDERAAPPFAAVWAAAGSAATRRAPRWPLPLAAGIALAIVAGTAVAVIRRDHVADPTPDEVVRAWERRSVLIVSGWTSPTAFLLEPPRGGTGAGAQEDHR